jgi:hypothetical protein
MLVPRGLSTLILPYAISYDPLTENLMDSGSVRAKVIE